MTLGLEGTRSSIGGRLEVIDNEISRYMKINKF